MILPAHGELWWAELDGAGGRPVVVLSRDAAIEGRRRTMAAACSTIIRGLPSEVILEPGEDPIDRRCVVQLDAVVDVHVRVLTHRLGRLSSDKVRRVCAALAVATGCS